MSKKILIIDDEELIIKSLTKLLERNGFDPFVAKRAQDALVILEEESFDLIISDIRMPGMNGIEFIKSMYSALEEKGVERPPVIFITGYADKSLEDEAKKLNPVAYIAKPFNIELLMKTIQKVIS